MYIIEFARPFYLHGFYGTASRRSTHENSKMYLDFGDLNNDSYLGMNPSQFGTFRRKDCPSLFISWKSSYALRHYRNSRLSQTSHYLFIVVPGFALLNHLSSHQLIHSDAKRKTKNLEKST